MTIASRPLPFALLFLCGALSAVLLRQSIGPEREFAVPSITSHAVIPGIPRIPVFHPPPAQLLVEIPGRPIFNPSRQPINPMPENEKPPPAPQVTFIGTMSEAGQQTALVKTPGNPQAFTIKPGATIAGWQVTDISPQRILFSAKSANFEAKLSQPPAVPARSTQANKRRNPTQRGRRSPAITATAAPQLPTPPAPPLPNPNIHFRSVQVP